METKQSEKKILVLGVDTPELDKCSNCGNEGGLDYSAEFGEMGSEQELIKTYGFTCPVCDEFTEIEVENVLADYEEGVE